jgi:hypothetical protein
LRKLLVLALLFGIWGVSIADNKPAKVEAQPGQKKGNTCYTESVDIVKGTSFPVKVFVSNVDTLAGMQVPIYFRSEDVNLVCDSVTFTGSRCAYFALSFFKIDPVGKTVFFTFILMTDANQTVQPLSPGDGLVATLWFTAPKDIKSGKVKLDSGPAAFFPDPRIDYSFLFWTPMALQVDCAYNPGFVTIK